MKASNMGPSSFATTPNSQQTIFSTSIPPELRKLTAAAATLDKTIFRKMVKGNIIVAIHTSRFDCRQLKQIMPPQTTLKNVKLKC